MNPRLVPPARLARSVLRTQSDERLCELVHSGSDAAFEALVARHRRDLVRHCARIVGDGDAEEAVQECLVRAHAALSRGTEVQRVAPWLRVIAQNAALNLLRARNSRGPTCPVDAIAEPSCEDRAAEQRLELDELVAAVGALPERQRDAIVMRELEGRSYAEIAARLDSSPGAVRQLLSRARTTVRARLAGLLPVNVILRWLPTAPTGTAGTRVGALSDGCVATVKLCAALIPAAALGAGVADHISDGARAGRAHASVRAATGRAHHRTRLRTATIVASAGTPVTARATTAFASRPSSATVARVSYVSATVPNHPATGVSGSRSSTDAGTAGAHQRSTSDRSSSGGGVSSGSDPSGFGSGTASGGSGTATSGSGSSSGGARGSCAPGSSSIGSPSSAASGSASQTPSSSSGSADGTPPRFDAVRSGTSGSSAPAQTAWTSGAPDQGSGAAPTAGATGPSQAPS